MSDSPYAHVYNSGESVVLVKNASIEPDDEIQDRWKVIIDYVDASHFPNENRTDEELEAGHAALHSYWSKEQFRATVSATERTREGVITDIEFRHWQYSHVAYEKHWFFHDLAVFLISTIDEVDSTVYHYDEPFAKRFAQ